MSANARFGFRTADGAVSSTVGTVLLIAITVTVFSAVSFVVIGQFSEDQSTSQTDIGALSDSGVIVTTHQGGEALGMTGGKFLVNVNGAEVEVPFSDANTQFGWSDSWSIGKAACFGGNDPSCLFTGQDVQGVMVIHSNAVVMEEGQRAGTTVLKPDLTVSLTNISPASPNDGESVTFQADVQNVGTQDISPGTAITVEFFVDGNLLNLHTNTGGLASGASFTALSNAFFASTGDMDLSIEVDRANTISEAAEGNNVASQTITVAALAPDLTVDAPTITSTTVEGQPIDFTAVIRNVGNVDINGVASAVRYEVRLTSSSTWVTVDEPAGSLTIPAGGTGALPGTWTNPAIGSYFARAVADPNDSIIEGDETNNISPEMSFTVIADQNVPAGDSFQDNDGDGVYDPNVDTIIPSTELADGHYNVQDACVAAGGSCPDAGLVIPPTADPINADSVNLKADGAVVLQVNVISTSRNFCVESESGYIDVRGVTISAGTNNIGTDDGGCNVTDCASDGDFDAELALIGEGVLGDGDTILSGVKGVCIEGDGFVEMPGTSFTASEGDLIIRAPTDYSGPTSGTGAPPTDIDYRVDIPGAVISVRDNVWIDARDGITLDDGSINLSGNWAKYILIEATGGLLSFTNAELYADEQELYGDSIDGDGSDLRATSTIIMAADSGTFSLVGGAIQTADDVTVDATSRLDLDGANIDVSNGKLTVSGDAFITATGAMCNLYSSDDLKLDGKADVDVSNCTLESGDKLMVWADDQVFAPGATLISSRNRDVEVHFQADDYIDVSGAEMRYKKNNNDKDHVKFQFADGSPTLEVLGAEVYKGTTGSTPGKSCYNKGGTTVIGVMTAGTVEQC